MSRSLVTLTVSLVVYDCVVISVACMEAKTANFHRKFEGSRFHPSCLNLSLHYQDERHTSA